MFLEEGVSENIGCHQLIIKALRDGKHPQAPEINTFQPTSVMGLFTLEADTNLIFIQKADIEGYPWRNQMAFPGGNSDPEDLSREATALRELEEELHIPKEEVEMIGSIGHFQTINNRDIEAFLGIWKKTGDISHNISNILFDKSEISRVINIPLRYLIKVHKDNNFIGRLPGIYELTYPYQDVVVWGVTAKIIHHLMEIIIPRIS
ncbi:MAG: CoA pyrophosphatase [Desulfamplus sp.]|nr:CoA pyrophosphatase [Desulfamplus sp.]MBF0411292.1 CoA pyrophosphatase [Desulfamplus sp.]